MVWLPSLSQAVNAKYFRQDLGVFTAVIFMQSLSNYTSHVSDALPKLCQTQDFGDYLPLCFIQLQNRGDFLIGPVLDNQAGGYTVLYIGSFLKPMESLHTN